MVKKLIIIPAYNEEASIGRTLKEVSEKAAEFDCVVINDCSEDETAQVCLGMGVTVLNLAVNLGIGGAMQTGYRYAFENGYDCAAQIDADGQHDPAFLQEMFKILCCEEADMVIGSRFLEKKGYQSSALRRGGIRYFSRLIRALTGQTVMDPTSGMRMVNRALIEEFAQDYPADYPEPDSLVRALKLKKRVVEVPVVMRERMAGESSIRFGRPLYYMIKVSLAVILERMKKN